MSVDIKLHLDDIQNVQTPMLAVPVFSDTKSLPERLAFLNSAIQPGIKTILSLPDFEARLNQYRVVHTANRNLPLLVFVGAGKINEWDLEKAREVWGKAVDIARELKIANLGIFWDDSYPVPSNLPAFIPEVVAAMCTAAYRVREFTTKTEELPPEIQTIHLLMPGMKVTEELIKTGKILGESVNLTRRLGEYPANLMTPSRFVEEIQKRSEALHWDLEILDGPALEAKGLNAILAVARGSDHAPYLAIARYSHPDAVKTVGLVGKGVTFDTGGISIKPSKNMEEMKYDMCGAAAVLGALNAISATALPINVVAAMPVVENMPSGKSTRPGDIVKSYSGKTIEIINTDAEGRLILADALSYLETNYKPDVMVDLATLTGAAIVALGHLTAAVLTSNQDLLEGLEEAANISGEKIWRLPLWDDYGELMKSELADIRNIGTKPEAGVITAAIFLKNFVKEVPWAHLDIAGTAWSMPEKAYRPKGATGYGVRLLWHFVSLLTED